MSEAIKIRSGIREIVILVSIALLIFFYFNYSWIGARLYVGILLLYFIPFFIFLDSFDLAIEEKLIFSFFIGIGVTPLVVYYVAKLLISFRTSILVSFLILMAGSYLFRKFYKKKVLLSQSEV